MILIREEIWIDKESKEEKFVFGLSKIRGRKFFMISKIRMRLKMDGFSIKMLKKRIKDAPKCLYS